MNRILIAACILSLVCTLSVVGQGDSESGAELKASGSSLKGQAKVAMEKRGEYLVELGGCNNCHTPCINGAKLPEPDQTRRFSGHPADITMPMPPALPEGPWSWFGSNTNTAFAGPWGVSYAINLTVDADTGLGLWTEEIFTKALRSGLHRGDGRPILPPMPWKGYAHLTINDFKAIYFYLSSLPGIKNNVPESTPAALTETAVKK